MIRTNKLGNFIGKNLIHISSGVLYKISSIEQLGDYVKVVATDNSNIIFFAGNEFAPFKRA